MADQNPFITTANPMQQTFVDPEAQALQRQRQLAASLMQKAMQQPEGQMISGHFVAPSIGQYLAGLGNAYFGNKMMESADVKQQELAEQMRRVNAQEAQDIVGALTGSQATVPEGQTLRDDQGNLTYGAQEGVAPNPQLALARALSARGTAGQAMLPSIMKQVMPEEFNLAEGEIRWRKNPQTGAVEKVAAGGEKYHAPTTIDLGNKVMIQYPNGQVQYMPKTQAGHVVETDNGPVLVNTQTGQASPITMGGQPVEGTKGLSESQGQAVGFGLRAKEANQILTTLENTGTRTPGKIKAGLGGVAEAVPLIGSGLKQGANFLTNWTQSDQQQAVEQARLNFATAVLRKESGATISPSEFATLNEQYFPQPGDSEKTLKQKQTARDLAIRAIAEQAGPGKKKIEQYNPNLAETSPAASNAQKLKPEDQQALDWANKNPQDPRAVQIKKKLGQ